MFEPSSPSGSVADAVGAGASTPAVATLPSPQALAALGPVLCVYRGHGGELAGWAQARHAAAWCSLDTDGLHEALLFFDRHGDCCWRLHLLPDSDFLMWERLFAALPTQAATAPERGLAERLWQQLRSGLGGRRWDCTVLRLHALPVAPGFAAAGAHALAASLVAPSAAGLGAARRIARCLAAGDAALHDDCCCRQAMHDPAPANASDADAVHSLIRLNPGAPA